MRSLYIPQSTILTTMCRGMYTLSDSLYLSTVLWCYCYPCLTEVSVTASVGTSVLTVDTSDADTGNSAVVSSHWHH